MAALWQSAVALTGESHYCAGISDISLCHFVMDFAQQFAYNCLQLCITKTARPVLCLFYLQGYGLYYRISGSTFVTCPITCIHIFLTCYVDIGKSFEGIVPKFELMQHKQAIIRSCFFVFIMKSLYSFKSIFA